MPTTGTDIGFTVAGAGTGFTVGAATRAGLTVTGPPGRPVSTGRGKTPPTPDAIVGISIVGFCVVPPARVGAAIVGSSAIAA